jgi:hypothetical protein
MEFDGDFLTVYLNNRNTVFLELVRVDKSMADLLYGVIKGEQVTFNDTTPWPRRADKRIEAGKTYRTAEILRLRTNEGRDSELITEMPVNAVVHVLETGVKDTIDNITANWVKVRLDNETEGWCFGGYLLPDVPVESVAARQDNDGQEVAAIESQPQTAFPFSILIAVAGGAVILAVIVVILIRRKR